MEEMGILDDAARANNLRESEHAVAARAAIKSPEWIELEDTTRYIRGQHGLSWIGRFAQTLGFEIPESERTPPEMGLSLLTQELIARDSEWELISATSKNGTHPQAVLKKNNQSFRVLMYADLSSGVTPVAS